MTAFAAPLAATDIATAGREPALLGVEHSITGRRWVQRPADERGALAISQQLGVPDIVGRILAARGIPPEG
ncbi:MAG TPA: single-stranded-DNA-specific exonuclease RecJ, partial [Stellaceae bacterium]